MLVDPYALPQRLFTNKTRGCIRSAVRMRHGIVTLSAPGMTAAKTSQSQPGPAKETVPLDRFKEVGGACRFEAAAGARSTQKGQDWRNEQLIAANQKTHEKEHQGARIEARSARRNHSSFSA